MVTHFAVSALYKITGIGSKLVLFKVNLKVEFD